MKKNITLLSILIPIIFGIYVEFGFIKGSLLICLNICLNSVKFKNEQ